MQIKIWVLVLLVITLLASVSFAEDECCGDGVDNDVTGGDLACPFPDADADGFSADGSIGGFEAVEGSPTSAKDCDDSDRYMYAGIYRACGASGTQVCRNDGTFSNCVEGDLCEASGGKCFYVDALFGSDANDGTSRATAWSSLSKAEESGLASGNVVYLMSGIYPDGIEINDTSNFTLKAYPGENPVIDRGCTRTNPCDWGIKIGVADRVLIEGIHLTGTFQTVNLEGGGLRIDGATNSEFRNLKAYNNDGEDGTNTTGIYVKGATLNNHFHHNELYDNYKTAEPGNANNRNMVLFGGNKNRITHSVFRYTEQSVPNNRRSCLSYKHADRSTDVQWEAAYNILSNCGGYGIQNGQPGHLHHNRIIGLDSTGNTPDQLAAFYIGDIGGTTHHRNIVVEYNTVVNSRPFVFSPSETYSPLGPLTIRYNNFQTNFQSNSGEAADISIGHYSDNSLKASLEATNYIQDNNCYFNSNGSMRYSYFGSNSSPASNLGGIFSFSGWKNETGFDSNSHEVDPRYDSQLGSTAPECMNKGWLASKQQGM